NRDLHTFNVSIETSKLLARAAPGNAILVSESGLDPQAVRELHAAGYQGFLVGETLMRAADPATALREFTGASEGRRWSRSSWIKICGITNLEDARAAIDAGADLLGFNFYPRSPRFIEPQAAGKIISAIRSGNGRRRPLSTVGVFVDESIEQVARIVTEVKLNGIQLHGDENLEYCRRLKDLLPERFLIKAVAAQPGQKFKFHGEAFDAIMVDAFAPQLHGGTGRIADWSFARDLTAKLPRVFLAGGLSPENVGNAIAAVQPYGVDACSSLETAPGRKSARRMLEFVRAVRASTLQDETSDAMTREGK
ncbi:MAG TPA: bifunctional indole-3-glycerol phosphate synthase/phosphoribosylanthranilate isomerase, partial [Pyrinomonadaceae bacterium]|nr:bifunctional indole-3-glycerol phosphate synthase/phosphoribosylanthranilate isomerase [Pyrinomonadaceae bacterium]